MEEDIDFATIIKSEYECFGLRSIMQPQQFPCGFTTDYLLI